VLKVDKCQSGVFCIGISWV